MRREFPKPVRLAAWERARGCCETCGVKIRPGNGPHYDHVLPDALGGQPVLDNCQVLCKTCHGYKTHTDDVPRISKAVRVREKSVNARLTGRGFPKPPPGYDPWTRRMRED